MLLATEKLESDDYINIGSGVETPIKELVSLIQKLTHHKGEIVYDSTKPNGQQRRSVDLTKARTLVGFDPAYSLEEGLIETIAWYRAQKNQTLTHSN